MSTSIERLPHEEAPSLGFYLLITCLCSLGLLSSDMFLPSLPSLTSDFHESPAHIQLTLSVFLLGLASFQIAFGALSDRLGRKRVLLIGLGIYGLATLSCALATNLPALLIGRFVQAIGACSGLVIGRAIVADRYGPQGGARILSIVFPFVAMSPAVAPIIGGYCEEIFGWRSSFFLLSLYSMALLVGTWRSFDAKAAAPVGRLSVKGLANIASHPLYMSYVIAITCAYGAYFGYISASPFILKQMGETAVTTGYLYIPVAAPYIISALVGRRLCRRHALSSLVLCGMVMTFIGAVLLVGFAATGMVTRTTLFVPMAILTAGNGLILPFGSAAAMALFPKQAGTASGIVGTMQLGGAALVSIIVATVNNGHLLQVAEVIVAVAALGLVSFIAARCAAKLSQARLSGQATLVP